MWLIVSPPTGHALMRKDPLNMASLLTEEEQAVQSASRFME